VRLPPHDRKRRAALLVVITGLDRLDPVIHAFFGPSGDAWMAGSN